MIGRIHRGQSIRGAIRYSTAEDTPDETGKPRGRVGWTYVYGIPGVEDPELAGRIMQGVVYDAPALKRQAGIPMGRPLEKPVAHLILSFHESEFTTTDVHKRRKEILKTVRSALRSLGLEDRQAVITAHVDKDHLHVHVVVSRVCPRTGIAADMTQDQTRINAWALKEEQSRGRIVCPARLARHERRQRPTDQRGPVPRSETRRGPGRDPRTPYEKRQWTKFFVHHRAHGTPPDLLSAAKGVLAEELRTRRRFQERITAPIKAIKSAFTRAAKTAGATTPAARRPSSPRGPGPARYAEPVDARTAKPSIPAPGPRTSLRTRVTAQIKREDHREAQAHERATKALAAQAEAARAAEAAAREAAEAARAAEAAARAASAEQSKRAAARDAAIWKEAYANIRAQLDARQTRAATAPPPPPEETFVPPRSILADLERSNEIEDRRRAARSPTGSPTDLLPSERPMPMSAAPTTIRRRRRTTADPAPTATVPTKTTSTTTEAKAPRPRTATPKPAAAARRRRWSSGRHVHPGRPRPGRAPRGLRRRRRPSFTGSDSVRWRDGRTRTEAADQEDRPTPQHPGPRADRHGCRGQVRRAHQGGHGVPAR